MGVSIWPIGMEKAMAEFLTDFWMSLTNDDILEEWPSVRDALFKESGLVNDAPLFELLSNIMNKAVKVYRKLIVSATDTISGSYIPFDSDYLSLSEIPLAVLSSAANPVLFPDVKLRGYVLLDGGIANVINLASAVEKCLEVVDSQDKIIMDIAVCDYAQNDKLNQTGTTIENL